jgi:hypothetical protein
LREDVKLRFRVASGDLLRVASGDLLRVASSDLLVTSEVG